MKFGRGYFCARRNLLKGNLVGIEDLKRKIALKADLR